MLLSSALKLTLQAIEAYLGKHVQIGTVKFPIFVTGSPSVAQWLHFRASVRKGRRSTPAEGLRFVCFFGLRTTAEFSFSSGKPTHITQKAS